MKVPKRQRSGKRKRLGPKANADRAEIARRVTYVGSQHHKDIPSYAGSPTPRPDASICPLKLSQDPELPTRWLRTAIERGATGADWSGDFPKYAWYREGGVVYIAQLTNQALGQYKGYPLNNESEWPEGLDEFYD